MDYVFDISVESLKHEPAKASARKAFEDFLGGSPAHVVAVWLDCQAEGGTLPIHSFADRMGEAQTRWNKACNHALRVYIYGENSDAKADEDETYGERTEFSWVSAVPANISDYADKGAWQEAFLTRLSALKYDTYGATPHEVADWNWDDYKDCHPVCAADEVGLAWEGEQKHPLAGEHPYYLELRAQVALKAMH